MFSSIREIAENIKNSPCFNGSIEYSAPLKDYTTMKVGGPAEVLVSVNDTRSALFVLRVCRNENAPVFILGGGSNLIVNDSGIKGFVLRTSGLNSITMKPSRPHPFTLEDYEPVNEAEDIFLSAGSGCTITELCSWCERYGIYGLVKFSGLPGTIGGAMIMNAGAYGGEIKDVLIDATVLTADNHLETLTVDDLDLSYRHSTFMEMENPSIILSARLKLAAGNQDEIKATIDDIKQKRIEKQPLTFPSAGSTFKRPEGFFAGKLIDDTGLRGYTVGGAQVSEKHCGFVINKSDASAADVLQLMKDVDAKVYDKFGVHLTPEVRIIGRNID